MGRYYNGDIEGKFWFGVQSSSDADFFGVMGCEPQFLEYFYSEDDLPTIEDGVKKCITHLGKYKDKLDYFFNEGEGKSGYNDEMVMKALSITEKKVQVLLEWYARLQLGEKILACVKENGSCQFQAEL